MENDKLKGTDFVLSPAEAVEIIVKPVITYTLL